MPFFHYNCIKVSAVAAAVPTETVRLSGFIEKYGKSAVERFSEMTGVREFRRSKQHQTASDFGYVAAEKILTEKKVDRESIGALVFVAHSTDYRRPATACVLHKRLNLSKDCAAFDINLGCSAIVYGLQVLCSLIDHSDIEKGLLIVGETLTKMVNPNDRTVNMLFGDGGAALLIEKDRNSKEGITILLKTDGKGYRAIIAPAGGYRNMDAPHEDMLWPDGNTRNLYNSYMNGTDVFSFTISEVPKTVREFLTRTGTTPEDYDCFAFHQANQFIHKQLAKKLKIPMIKMPLCLDRYGNTSAPAAALALCDAYGADTSQSPLRTMFCCFGVGLSWGVASVMLHPCDIFPIMETDVVFEEGIINQPFY